MYITDDYIGWTYKDFYLSKYFTSQLEKYFHLCLTSSIARFTVGKKMEQEYTKRYNLVFTTVMDGIDTNLYKDRPTKILKDEISFYYLGSLEPNRWFNLKQIGLALTELNITQNKKLKLIIHSFKNDKIKYAEKFEDINCIEFKDPLPFEDVPKCQMNADILIHVESFEESTASVMTKYSISTKIFQYLASGTPILAFGPRDIASIDFLRDFVTATIVDEMSMEVLKDRLSYIINNLSKINSDSEKTRNYALTNLSLDAISNQFAVEIISRSNNSTQQ
jgi:glycosyltransferase involved in cell wall biosynthesis